MASKKKSGTRFTAHVKLELYVEVPVTGATFEDALASAKELQVVDCVSFGPMGWMDGELKLESVNRRDD